MSHSTLASTLKRHGRDDWRWQDGTPAPQVSDCRHPSNYRCRTYGTGGTYVEVLLRDARRDETLAWCLDTRYQRAASGDHTGPLVIDEGGARRAHIRPCEDPLHGHEPLPEQRGPIPRIALVPIADWDSHWEEHPYGASWDLEHEAAILQRAYDLGWRPPDGWESRSGWRAAQ